MDINFDPSRNPRTYYGKDRCFSSLQRKNDSLFDKLLDEYKQSHLNEEKSPPRIRNNKSKGPQGLFDSSYENELIASSPEFICPRFDPDRLRRRLRDEEQIKECRDSSKKAKKVAPKKAKADVPMSTQESLLYKRTLPDFDEILNYEFVIEYDNSVRKRVVEPLPREADSYFQNSNSQLLQSSCVTLEASFQPISTSMRSIFLEPENTFCNNVSQDLFESSCSSKLRSVSSTKSLKSRSDTSIVSAGKVRKSTNQFTAPKPGNQDCNLTSKSVRSSKASRTSSEINKSHKSSLLMDSVNSNPKMSVSARSVIAHKQCRVVLEQWKPSPIPSNESLTRENEIQKTPANSEEFLSIRRKLHLHRSDICRRTIIALSVTSTPIIKTGWSKTRYRNCRSAISLMRNPLTPPQEMRCRRSFLDMLTPSSVTCHVPTNDFDLLLQNCRQTELLSTRDFFKMLNIDEKIGEGSYAEVYRISTTEHQYALKIISVGGVDSSGAAQPRFGDILTDVLISKEICTLKDGKNNMTKNFVYMKKAYFMKGRFSAKMISLWKVYASKHETFLDNPATHDKDQHYVAMQYEMGGCSLENYQLKSWNDAISIFKQIAFTLAVAEMQLKFEHRDLHWGNVLIKATNNHENVTYILDEKPLAFPSNGVHVTIIDFTLSRLQGDECVVFFDINKDPEIFNGTGDYQFEIYRMMKKHTGDDWGGYYPWTNVLWLHYLISKLLEKKPRCRRRAGKEQLSKWKESLLSFQSALSFVTNYLVN